MIQDDLEVILAKVQCGELSKNEAEQWYQQSCNATLDSVDVHSKSVQEYSLDDKHILFGVDRFCECIKPSPAASVRLLLFLPFGFGNESLRWSWTQAFKDKEAVEVWIVGTDKVSSWENLIPYLSDCLVNIVGQQPFCVYGHSMGGIVGYETLRYVEQNYGLSAALFIPSSICVPEVFQRLKNVSPFADINSRESLSDARFLLEQSQVLISKSSGISSLSDEGLVNDIELMQSYQYDYTDECRLNCDVLAIQSNNDVLIPDGNSLARWQEYSSKGYQYTEVEGSHLVFMNPPNSFFKALMSIVNECSLAELSLNTASDAVVTLGSYRLKTFESGTADVKTYPFSLQPKGYLLYLSDGTMAAHIWNPSRETLNRFEGDQTSDAPQFTRVLNYLSYTGRYRELNGVIQHDIELSTDPNFVGETLTRYLDLNPTTFCQRGLTLHTAPYSQKQGRQSQSHAYHKLDWVECDKVESESPLQEKLEGSWVLASLDESSLVNENLRILFSSDGFFSIQVSSVDLSRPRFDQLLLASDEELKQVLRETSSYCGYYSFDGLNDKGDVTIRLTIEQALHGEIFSCSAKLSFVADSLSLQFDETCALNLLDIDFSGENLIFNKPLSIVD
ncbi:MAG: surfactin synthase thioesterase subunit [Flavobacteriales bacterium]|jgi:surfactin synthase thioesterase subunit